MFDSASPAHGSSSFRVECDAAEAFAERIGFHGWRENAAHPSLLAARIEASARNIARLLGKSGNGLAHSGNLDAAARAAGYPHWHALHTHTQRIRNDRNSISGKVREDRDPSRTDQLRRSLKLSGGLPMLTMPERGKPPTPAELNGLQHLANALATHAGITLQVAQDVVARNAYARNWDGLLRGDTADLAPLYTFLAHKPGMPGSLRASLGCRNLWLRLIEVIELTDPEHPNVRSRLRKARPLLDKLLAGNPTFFEGFGLQSSIVWSQFSLAAEQATRSQKLLSEYLSVIDFAIERAESFFPSGFDGTIASDTPSGTTYNRLLNEAFERKLRYGTPAQALNAARKLIQRSDQRTELALIMLPALEAANGNTSEAFAQTQRLDQEFANSEPNVQHLYTRAFVSWVQGDKLDAIQDLLRCVFLFPGIKTCSGRMHLDAFRQWHEYLESIQNIRLADYRTADLDMVNRIASQSHLPQAGAFNLMLRALHENQAVVLANAEMSALWQSLQPADDVSQRNQITRPTKALQRQDPALSATDRRVWLSAVEALADRLAQSVLLDVDHHLQSTAPSEQLIEHTQPTPASRQR